MSTTAAAASLDVKVISLQPRPNAILRLAPHFPEARPHRAVDLRRASAVELVGQGAVTLGAYFPMTYGRRWHHELPSGGAVGLRASMVSALRESDSSWLLLCEDDVVPGHGLHDAVRRLIDSSVSSDLSFDAAFFGSSHVGATPAVVVDRARGAAPPGWEWLRRWFFGTHCVLWSPAGRQRGAELLEDPRTSDVQVDVAFAALHHLGRMNCLMQTGKPLATQQLHLSSIQQLEMGIAHAGEDVHVPLVYWLFLATAFVVLVFLVSKWRRRVAGAP